MSEKKSDHYNALAEWLRPGETTEKAIDRRRTESWDLTTNRVSIVLADSRDHKTKLVFGYLDLGDEGTQAGIKRMDSDIVDRHFGGKQGSVMDLDTALRIASNPSRYGISASKASEVKGELIEAVKETNLLTNDQKKDILGKIEERGPRADLNMDVPTLT